MGVIWDRNNKTAQTEMIQFVSRELGCRDQHCVSARTAVSATASKPPHFVVRNLTKTSRERENPCEEMHTERNRTNQFSESFNGLVLISEIPVPLAQGLDTNDPAEETQLRSPPSASVIRLLSLGSSYQMSSVVMSPVSATRGGSSSEEN